MLSSIKVCLLLTIPLYAQEPRDIPSIEDYWESVAENSSGLIPSESFDPNIDLQIPIPINAATPQDLENLGVLSPQQIHSLMVYREQLGPLLSLQELQAVPHLDLFTIYKVLPLVYLDNIPIRSPGQRRGGQSHLFVKFDQSIEKKRGFTSDPETNEKPFEGDPKGLLLRFMKRNRSGWSFGCTLEKDPGESLFKKSNSHGFDFQSLHFYYYNPDNKVHTVAIGDFITRFGQGLLVNTGYSSGKTFQLSHLKKAGQTIRPYSGREENRFLRGGALSWGFNRFNFTVFGSDRTRDANITDNAEVQFGKTFSSLQTSGLHRTKSEIDDEKMIRQRTIGMRVDFTGEDLSVGLNYLFDQFNYPYIRQSSLYSQFRFSGRNAFGTSVDYSFRLKNLHFFGEVALSGNLAVANLHGVLLGLSKFLDAGMLWRSYPRNYWSVWGDSFRESGEPVNEKGLYLGFLIRFNSNWNLSGFADYWIHPWLNYNTSAPSFGKECFYRLTYEKKRKVIIYAQWIMEQKMTDIRSEPKKYSEIVIRRQTALRIHVDYSVSRYLKFRNRIEMKKVQTGNDQPSNGFLVYQDIIFDALELPLKISARLAHFDTQDYETRIYAYERNVINAFSVPAYYLEGLRYYVNIRYSPLDFLTAELRWEQTRRPRTEVFGTGPDMIEGKKKSLVRLQIRYKF